MKLERFIKKREASRFLDDIKKGDSGWRITQGVRVVQMESGSPRQTRGQVILPPFFAT